MMEMPHQVTDEVSTTTRTDLTVFESFMPTQSCFEARLKKYMSYPVMKEWMFF